MNLRRSGSDHFQVQYPLRQEQNYRGLKYIDFRSKVRQSGTPHGNP